MKRQSKFSKLSNVLAVFSLVALLSLILPAGVAQAATRFVLAGPSMKIKETKGFQK